MHSRKPLLLCLLGIGLLLCAANVWFAARRSLIPLEIAAVVRVKELRPEKHPGIDDVCLLELSEDGWYQVDRDVFEAVNDGDRIRKAAWARELRRADETVSLSWSTDAAGIVWCMPSTLAILSAMAIHLGWRHPRRVPPTKTPTGDLHHPD